MIYCWIPPPQKKNISNYIIQTSIPACSLCSGVLCGTETYGISSLGWSSLIATLATEPWILTGQLDASRPVQPAFGFSPERYACSSVGLVEALTGLNPQSIRSLECPTRSSTVGDLPAVLTVTCCSDYSACSPDLSTCSPDLSTCIPDLPTCRPGLSTCSSDWSNLYRSTCSPDWSRLVQSLPVHLQSWLVYLQSCPQWSTGSPHWSTCSHKVALLSWLVILQSWQVNLQSWLICRHGSPDKSISNHGRSTCSTLWSTSGSWGL